jgi:hypothetical protein
MSSIPPQLTLSQRLLGATLGALGGVLYGALAGMGVTCVILGCLALMVAVVGCFLPGGPSVAILWFANPPVPVPELQGLSRFESLLLCAGGLCGLVGMLRGAVVGFWRGLDPVKVVGPLRYGAVGAMAGAVVGGAAWLLWPVPNLMFQSGVMMPLSGAGVGVMVAGMIYGTRYGPV